MSPTPPPPPPLGEHYIVGMFLVFDPRPSPLLFEDQEFTGA